MYSVILKAKFKKLLFLQSKMSLKNRNNLTVKDHNELIEKYKLKLNGGKSGNIEYVGMSTEQCVRILVHSYTV